MANDNRETQLAAMAEQDSKSALPTDETSESKTRTTSRQNTIKAILAMIDCNPAKDSEDVPGMIQAWSTGDDANETVVGALTFLRDKLQVMHDAPREISETTGRHYVGIDSEGNRTHFKSASVPKETSANCVNFKIVLGPYSTDTGAEYATTHGRRAKDVVVFHRNGAAKDLGARADYAAMLNAS